MQTEDHPFIGVSLQDHSLTNLTHLDTTLPPILGRSSLASSFSSEIIGEYIGMESCEDLVKSHESSHDNNKHGGLSKRDHLRGAEKVVKKEFPPPIPLLARTENLPAHMPWILKRHYTSDGRLILTEEKVRHHEYFLAHRSNGRLTLQLVPLDDEIFPPSLSFVDTQDDYEDEVEADKVDEECKMESLDLQDHDVDDDSSVVGDDNDDSDDYTDGGVGVVEEAFDYHEEIRVPSSMETGIAGNGTPTKCLDYSSVSGTTSFIFGVPLPAMRPVQS